MIINARQIVWTPMIGPTSVAVALDPAFAKACHEYVLGDGAGRVIAKQVWDQLGDKRSMMPSNFFDLEQNLLLKGIYYKPGEGVWMAMDLTTFPSVVFPVMYHGHNEDHFAGDRLALLRAFGGWVEYAFFLLSWD